MKGFKNIMEVQRFLRNIPYINHGGCAIAALVMYDYLVANKVEAKIVYAYHSYDPDYEANVSQLAKGGDYLEPCEHAMVSVNDVLHDCRGERSVYEYDKYHSISREMVVKSLNAKGWNSSFDREEYVPVIEEKIGYNIKLGSSQN